MSLVVTCYSKLFVIMRHCLTLFDLKLTSDLDVLLIHWHAEMTDSFILTCF